MTQFLIRRFVKHWQKTGDQSVRAAYGTLGSITGAALNVLLAAIKMLVGLVTKSVAITADGVNNLSDAGGSVMSLVSVRMAQKPMDREHPFGHGRAEYIGALGVGILILIFGFELLRSGAESILSPVLPDFSWVSVLLLVLGVLVKGWMSVFYKKIGTLTDNPTMLAASKDSLSDVLATGAVILSILLALLTGVAVDGYAGVLVSLFILRSGYSVIKDTVNRLLGGSPDKELGSKIIERLLSYEGVLGVHDFVLHDYGPGRSMASVHVEVRADEDFVAIHETIDRAEREITRDMHIPICIHMDPVVTDDEQTNSVCAEIKKYLASRVPALKLHDFRRVPGKKRVNLLFDVLLPEEIKDEQIETVRCEIADYAKTLDARYHCLIHFDRDYFTNEG